MAATTPSMQDIAKLAGIPAPASCKLSVKVVFNALGAGFKWSVVHFSGYFLANKAKVGKMDTSFGLSVLKSTR